MNRSEFWIVAGINGAGKSTLVSKKDIRHVLGDIETLNPDLLVPRIQAELPHLDLTAANLEAARITEELVDQFIEDRRSFLVETVLSTRKYQDRIERARQQGFLIGMIYVGLPTMELAVARVADRRAAGGHDVPEEKIRSRWRRSLDNLAAFEPLVDRLLVFSNASPDGSVVLVAEKKDGRLCLFDSDALPEITRRLRPRLG